MDSHTEGTTGFGSRLMAQSELRRAAPLRGASEPERWHEHPHRTHAGHGRQGHRRRGGALRRGPAARPCGAALRRGPACDVRGWARKCVGWPWMDVDELLGPRNNPGKQERDDSGGWTYMEMDRE